MAHSRAEPRRAWPRLVATLDAMGDKVARGDSLFRYAAPDYSGTPKISFSICTFWYIEALAATGGLEYARALFKNILEQRNPLRLLSEDIAPGSVESRGNLPQTCSLMGLIQPALRLSRNWEDAL